MAEEKTFPSDDVGWRWSQPMREWHFKMTWQDQMVG